MQSVFARIFQDCAWLFAQHGVGLHGWFCLPHVFDPLLALLPVRCSPRPLFSAADAAQLPGCPQRGGEGPGVAEC